MIQSSAEIVQGPAGLDRRSAIDHQDLTGDVARLVGCKEADGGGLLLRVGPPPQRDAGREVSQPLLVVQEGGTRSAGRPRRYGVDADSVRTHFDREGSDE